MKISMLRTRWAAVGAAVAITLGAGGLGISYATSPTGAVAFVPITPCRVLDTRPAPDNIGNRNTPIGAGETHAVTAHGNNGACTGIPAGATGLSLNVTTLGATSPTFVTLWATGAAQPTASNLNPQPGQPPTPNAVTTGLSATGQFNVFNAFGTVNVIIDIVGYYTDHQHTGADIVDESLTGADVQNNTIGSVDTQNEPGVSFDFMTDVVSATATPAAVAGTAMRAPSDGYVEIEVTGQWLNNTNAGVDTAWCQLQKGAAGAVVTADPWFIVTDRNVTEIGWQRVLGASHPADQPGRQPAADLRGPVAEPRVRRDRRRRPVRRRAHHGDVLPVVVRADRLHLRPVRRRCGSWRRRAGCGRVRRSSNRQRRSSARPD